MHWNTLHSILTTISPSLPLEPRVFVIFPGEGSVMNLRRYVTQAQNCRHASWYKLSLVG